MNSQALISNWPVRTARRARWNPSLDVPGARPTTGWALFLAVMAVLDPVVNQVNTLLPVHAGPFSLLQILRGALLAILLASALLAGQRGNESAPTRWLCLLVPACLVCFSLNEFYKRGELPFESIVAEVQILYWILAWHVASATVRGRAGGCLVANGLVMGCLVTALSVAYGYLAGTPNLYRTHGVEASTGWFVSAKGIAGTLTAGALLAGYLAWRRQKPSLYLVAATCVCALLLTYARAGIVALCCALSWLLIWVALNGFGRQSVWARRMLAVSAIASMVFLFQAGTESIVRRWSDLQQPSYAGSGRLVLWHAASERFLGGSPSDQMFGIGYAGMLDLTERATGMRLHAHSDPFDLLLMGGMVGVALLGVVLAGIVWQMRRVPFRSPEFAVVAAIFIVMLAQGCLTGQIFLPDVMAFYLLAQTAVLALGTETILR